MVKTSSNARTGVWVAIIIIIAILAAYGGYHSGFEDGLKRVQQGLQRGQGVSPTPPSGIKVGVIASNISHAPDILYGVQLARDLLNNKSDVALRNVTLSVKYLEREDPERVKYFVTSFINENFRVIIGALSNSEVKAILRMLYENDAILVLVSNEIYDNDVYDDPRVIKMLGGPEIEAHAMVDLALEIEKEDLRAAIIAANNSYCMSLANAISEAYSSRSGRIVSKVFYELGKTNITESLVNVSNLSPVIIFFVGQKDDAPAILDVARDMGLKAKWILSSTSASESLLKEHLASYLNGSCFVIRRGATFTLQFRDFAELFWRVYRSEPHEMAAYGFDSLVLVALSTAYAGKYSGSAIKGAMNLLCNLISGATGPKYLDSKGNLVQEYMILKLVGAYGDYRFEQVGRWIPIDVEKALIEWR